MREGELVVGEGAACPLPPSYRESGEHCKLQQRELREKLVLVYFKPSKITNFCPQHSI